MSEALLRNYLRKIEKVYQTGNATEHTYRSTLQALLETLSPGITVTNEPKRIKCGAPDFIITNKHTPLGYIETKDIGVSLDRIERTDQMKRYLGSLANLILTDYLEFRWYVSGQLRISAQLAKVGANYKLISEGDGIEKLTDLFQGYMLTQTPTVSNPKELAIRMAALAQLTRNAIRLAFESEEGGGSLHTQMEGFRQVLLPDLTYERFADMYAQSICYGLFAARCNTRPGITFTREHAAYDIPKTNPFLRKMFIYIAGPDLDERIVWIVDDLAELLNRSDMTTILQDFGKHTRQEDPVVHFYETFLAQYDPKLRELRGVYYTPEPVVSYIVRSVDHLLKKDFDIVEGLADATKLKAASPDGKYSLETHKVQILDPATGTGTFLYYVVRQIYEQFKDNRGMWSSYVSEHLLPRIFGFEILMAPYAVAHLKLGLQLRETGYDFRDKERLGVYLTNTLEEEFEVGRLPFAEWLVEEATAAGNVKYDAPVMVVLGNPPYSGHSANKGKWITELLHDKGGNYFEVDGKPLGERNPKWLNNDYVKFIRFAQWRIERTGYGILAFITDNSYLNSPTFRGMRQSLMHTFDEIYILDLHGNSKKKERSPDGTKDENVFDITQGVSIGIFVKRQGRVDTSHTTTVYHAHLWGTREVNEETHQRSGLVSGKYHWLAENDVTTTEWKILNPENPFYLFVPQDIDLRTEYEQGRKVTDIFPINNTGIITSRDKFVVGLNAREVLNRVSDFKNTDLEQARIKYNLNDVRERTLLESWNMIRKMERPEQYLTQILYRPFDVRSLFYHHALVRWPVYVVMHHMRAGKNLGFSTTRSTEIGRGWEHIFCSRDLIQHHTVSIKEVNYLFPLYLYPNPQKKELFDVDESSNTPGGRRPNLSPSFVADFSNNLRLSFIPDGKGDLQKTFGPENIFDYIYAVFHSPAYRIRYAEFLKRDFPRLPLTSNLDLFRDLCSIGDRLVGLHLMEQSGENTPKYPEPGNNMVERVEYTQSIDKSEHGRVWINKTQYFDVVSPEVWEFHVGGYQVCQKWLKDRKGRTLTYDERKHYQRIVAALSETITLMEQIDEVIDEHGGWPIV